MDGIIELLKVLGSAVVAITGLKGWERYRYERDARRLGDNPGTNAERRRNTLSMNDREWIEDCFEKAMQQVEINCLKLEKSIARAIRNAEKG